MWGDFDGCNFRLVRQGGTACIDRYSVTMATIAASHFIVCCWHIDVYIIYTQNDDCLNVLNIDQTKLSTNKKLFIDSFMCTSMYRQYQHNTTTRWLTGHNLFAYTEPPCGWWRETTSLSWKHGVAPLIGNTKFFYYMRRCCISDWYQFKRLHVGLYTALFSKKESCY